MSTAISDADVISAAKVLGKASLFDPRFAKNDEGKILAWAEALTPHRLRESDLIDAVVKFYSETRKEPLMAGDVIGIAKTIRRDRAEREAAADREARSEAQDRRHGLSIVQPDNQLGGLPIGGADGPPVPGAYLVNDAVDRHCDTCNAQPDHPCTNPINGQPRRIPCASRAKPLRTQHIR